VEPSHVLAAAGGPLADARGTLRFSFGKLTSGEDVERLIRMLPGAVGALRVAAPDLGTSASGPAWSRSEVHS
jgi:cysteine desulfurase